VFNTVKFKKQSRRVVIGHGELSFILFILAVLEFELRASCLLGKQSTT
jgi:hypothetical protein